MFPSPSAIGQLVPSEINPGAVGRTVHPRMACKRWYGQSALGLPSFTPHRPPALSHTGTPGFLMTSPHMAWHAAAWRYLQLQAVKVPLQWAAMQLFHCFRHFELRKAEETLIVS